MAGQSWRGGAGGGRGRVGAWPVDHIKVENREERMETEGFPEGWWTWRDSQPNPAWVGAP